MKPLFVVFEGLDGSGKTTQIRALERTLSERGEKVRVSAEPTDYASGRALREALSGRVRKTVCEIAVMFAYDRIVHNKEPESGIEATLAGGAHVISDRYYYSSLAYQGSQTDRRWVEEMNLSCPEIRKPDLCIFLDLSPEESMKRITQNRAPEEMEIYETVEKLTAVRETFHRVIKERRAAGEAIEVVNAGQSIDAVARDVLAAWDACYQKKQKEKV